LGVTLRNVGRTLAFFTRLRLLDERGAELAPAYFSDNYVSLLPGESIEVSVSCPLLAAAKVLEASAGALPASPARLYLD
jgi:hypothetical protein